MLLISHRGNLNGKNNKAENTINHINKALFYGFYVEIDVWVINKQIYLGHDYPKEKVSKNFIQNSKFFCHAKNPDALIYLSSTSLNYFWHENDYFTLTSHNMIWAHPKSMEYLSNKETDKIISVCPENIKLKINKNFYGICSDYIINYL